jgi:hypothetical protein
MRIPRKFDDRSDPALTFANPRGRNCFRGFPACFRFDDSIGRNRVAPKSPSSPHSPSWPSSDATFAMHRLIESDVPGCAGSEGGADARGLPRSRWKGKRAPENKSVSRYRTNWVRHYSLFLPFSPRLIFDQLWKLNVHVVLGVFNNQKRVSIVYRIKNDNFLAILTMINDYV